MVVHKVICAFRNVLFVLALAVIAALLLCMVFQIKPAVVLSGSMEPEIHTGSLALIDLKDRDADAGDAIAFRSGNVLVTHRIVREEGGAFVTKGDANRKEDLWRVSPEEIIGTTVYSIPYLGYVVQTFKNPAGITILVAGFLIFFVLSFLEPKLAYREDSAKATRMKNEAKSEVGKGVKSKW